jgi:putative FmdB family regulatory protein
MPLYEYQCDNCGHRFERIQKFSDPPVATCPECGGPVKKLLSSPAIQFKGTGWYVTDYVRPNAGTAGPPGDGHKSKREGANKAEPASTETKGETAAASGTDKPADKPAAPSKPTASKE